MPALVVGALASSETLERPAKRLRVDERPLSSSLQSSNPLEIKPLGNLLLHPEHVSSRTRGLGSLARLPDELLLSSLFGSCFNATELLKMQGVSRAFFAWTRVEGVWKELFIRRSGGSLPSWSGSWRASYVNAFLCPREHAESASLPTESITTSTLYSDVLYQPSLCAAFDANSLYGPSFQGNIRRLEGKGLSCTELPNEPVILTGLMESWAALQGERSWDLELLKRRFSRAPFRAEAVECTMSDYGAYHDRCACDESPLYVFDADFVERTAAVDERRTGGMGEDYTVPACFGQDLFKVFGTQRPDYRWLIAGPARSGSTWHQDPNSTSAWNAVVRGKKAWVMFDPSVTPPGVRVSADMGEVECPLSLAEWFQGYYRASRDMYGPRAKDPALRNKMKEGICREGEIFFVPSGWWHCVVNLTSSVAVTQNFVSQRELSAVLRFMRDRGDQTSGFKGALAVDCEDDDSAAAPRESVYDAFVDGLQREYPDLLEKALEEIKEEERPSKPTTAMSEESIFSVAEGGGGFSFGFDIEEDAEEEDATFEDGVVNDV